MRDYMEKDTAEPFTQPDTDKLQSLKVGVLCMLIVCFYWPQLAKRNQLILIFTFSLSFPPHYSSSWLITSSPPLFSRLFCRRLSLLPFLCAVLAVWWVGGGGCGWQAASTRRPSALQLLSHPQWVLERPGGKGLCQVSFHNQHMFLGCNVWDHPLLFCLCYVANRDSHFSHLPYVG